MNNMKNYFGEHLFLLRIITFIISEKNFACVTSLPPSVERQTIGTALNVLCEEMKSGTTKKINVKRSSRTQSSKEKVPAALMCEPWVRGRAETKRKENSAINLKTAKILQENL